MVFLAKSVVRDLLVYEPEDRINMADAMQHHWIQKDIERLEELYREVTL